MHDSEIFVEALRSEVESRGMSVREISSAIGKSPSVIHYWLRGEMSPRQKSYAAICEILPAAKLAEIDTAIGLPADVSESVRERLRKHHAAVAANSATAALPKLGTVPADSAPAMRPPRASDFPPDGPLTLVSPSEMVRVPVIALASASMYRQCIGPAEFASEFADSAVWEHVPEGHLLMRVEGNSMYPLIAHNSVLQVDMVRHPRRGELVVALISCEDQPVVKYYHRKDYVVILQSVNPEGRTYRIDLKDEAADTIHWMQPVVKVTSSPPPPPSLPDFGP